jgi:hypothetical protein
MRMAVLCIQVLRNYYLLNKWPLQPLFFPGALLILSQITAKTCLDFIHIIKRV